MSAIRKLKYEDFFEEPPAFKYMGGFMPLFKSALNREATLRQDRVDIFDDAFAAGRDEGLSKGLEIGVEKDRKATYQEGYSKGRLMGQHEGAKLFALEGGEYVTAHQETGMFQGYKTIETLMTDPTFKKETIDYLVRKHGNETKTTLEKNIPIGDVNAFQQALDKITGISKNKSTLANTTKNKYITEMIARNNDITTFEGKKQLFKDVKEYQSHTSFGRDWQSSGKASSIIQGMDDYLKGLEQTEALPVQVEQARATKKDELKDMTDSKLRKSVDFKMSDVPFVLSDTVNVYNVKQLRNKKTEGHLDWRSNKSDIGVNIQDYLFQPKASPEPTFTSGEDINKMLVAVKNAPIPNPFGKPIRQQPRLTLKDELKSMSNPLVSFDEVEITPEGIFEKMSAQVEEIFSPPITPIKAVPQQQQPTIRNISTEEVNAEFNLRNLLRGKLNNVKAELEEVKRLNAAPNATFIEDTTQFENTIAALERISRSDNLYEDVIFYYKNRGIPHDLKAPVKELKKVRK